MKKSSDVDKNKRPAQSERQRILAELKEQRINEVTEPDPGVGAEGSTTSSSSSSSTSTSDGKPTIGSAASGAVSSSGKGKYTRGQDSSTLGVRAP